MEVLSFYSEVYYYYCYYFLSSLLKFCPVLTKTAIIILLFEMVFIRIIEPKRIESALTYIFSSRVIKTELEKELMRQVARISGDAHKAVMTLAKPGIFEYQCEAMFQHYVYHSGGCRHVAYTCICASGENGSVLHYGGHTNPNRKFIKDGDLW